MRFNKRYLIILLIVLAAAVIICAASAHDVSAAKTSKTNIKIHNFKPGVLWAPKAGNNGDIEPHHTKLVKVKFFFKNNNGKVKTKTVKGNSAHISTKLIKGYVPYKATVWYTTK